MRTAALVYELVYVKLPPPLLVWLLRSPLEGCLPLLKRAPLDFQMIQLTQIFAYVAPNPQWRYDV